MTPTLSELLPLCVVVANGAYWRDYGTHYSMCPVSTDNEPVEPVAVYERAPDEDWRGVLRDVRPLVVELSRRSASHPVAGARVSWAFDMLARIDKAAGDAR